jgi:hypothetical protein
MKTGFSWLMAAVVAWLLFGLGSAPALALYPPVQNVTAVYQGSAGVHYAATDPIYNQVREETWTVSQGDERIVESLQTDRGIVTWIARHKNYADTEYTFEVHYRVYDPCRGAWKGGSWVLSSGYQRQISEHQVKDGVVAWKTKVQVGELPNDDMEYKVCYVTYEPGSGSWPMGVDTYREAYDSPVSPEVLRVHNGVIAYPMNPLDSTNVPVHMRAYDYEVNQWVVWDDIGYNVDLHFDWVEIVEGTVRIHESRFYVVQHDVDNWWPYDPYTHDWDYAGNKDRPDPIRRASFTVEPVASFPPLNVCYWDTSFAMDLQPATWSYSFGDGTTSNSRSGVHSFKDSGSYLINLTVNYPENYGPTPYQATAKQVKVLDITPPTGGITINGGDIYTGSRNVSLALHASPDTTQMRFRNPMYDPSFNSGVPQWRDWEPFVTTHQWYLTAFVELICGGPHDVTVQFKDASNNVSPEYTDSIILDLCEPSGTVTIDGGAETITNPGVTVAWSATDNYGMNQMRYTTFNEGLTYSVWPPWEPYQPTTKAISFNAIPGQKKVIVEFMDKAGNISQVQSSVELLGSDMPLPESQLVYTTAPFSAPFLNPNPALARPIGIGDVASGGGTLDVTIGTVEFSGPADVYFGVFSLQTLGNDIFLYNGETFVALSQAGLVPWIAGTTGPLDQDLFGAIPVSLLPSGTYTLYFAVGPAGSSLATYYIWSTAFTLP